jgi:uncharacterized membrane protein
MQELSRKIIRNFLIGVFAFIPIAVIIQIVLILEGLVSGLLHLVYGYSESYLLTAVLFVVSFALFTYVGYRISVGRSVIFAVIEAFIDKIPVLNSIYRVTKKIVNMISGHEEKMPREVVYIEYPKEGLWVPAYVTNREQDKYILFVPTSPNPTSGFTIIVHESKVVKSSMNIEQATSFIVSVGVDFEASADVKKLS